MRERYNGYSRGRSTRRVTLILAVVCAVIIAGCAGFGTDAADGDSDEEPTVADESNDGDSSDADDANDDETTNDGSDTGASDASDTGDASEEDPNADAVPDDAGEDFEPEEQSAEGTLEIDAIDVGQADATLLIGPRRRF